MVGLLEGKKGGWYMEVVVLLRAELFFSRRSPSPPLCFHVCQKRRERAAAEARERAQEGRVYPSRWERTARKTRKASARREEEEEEKGEGRRRQERRERKERRRRRERWKGEEERRKAEATASLHAEVGRHAPSPTSNQRGGEERREGEGGRRKEERREERGEERGEGGGARPSPPSRASSSF